MPSGYILPITAKIIPEIIDYMFNSRTDYIGFSIKPGFLADFTARQVTKVTGNEVVPVDVIRTWQQMVADRQLIESGYYYPDKLYSLIKE